MSVSKTIKQAPKIAYILVILLSFLLITGSSRNSSAKDIVPIAANDPDGAPKVSFPDIPQLAAEMKLSEKDLERQTSDFADALSQGHRSKAFGRICTHNESTCQILHDFFAQIDSTASEHHHHRHIRKKSLILRDAKAISRAQSMDIQQLITTIKLDSESKFVALAGKAMQTVDCPKNLNAALVIHGEEFFPSPQARALTKQLFASVKNCLSKDVPFYERIFLRQGLYAYAEGDRVRAKDLLTLARDANNPQEHYRSLYWLGRLSKEDNVKDSNNQAWQDLINIHPLSFYAIDASVRMKKDPLVTLANHRVGGFKRSIPGKDLLNQEVQWLEALYLYKKFNAVAKLASWIARNTDNMDVDMLHYISTLKIASGLYRSNIAMLFGYFKKHPADLNIEGLKLLYPRPFFQLVYDTSKDKIDPFFVIALMRQESAFDPRAKSQVNARGLMQLMPKTARRLASNGQRLLFNEKANTTMGVKYLLNLAEKFNGKMELVLAAYNAGPIKVEEWLQRNERKDFLLWNDLIPYMETRDYVASILRNDYFYVRLYGYTDTFKQSPNVYSSELVTNLLATKK